MKRFNKLISGIMILCLLVAAMVTGCNNNKEKETVDTQKDNSQVKKTDTEDSTVSKESKEIVELDWYLGGTPQDGEDEVFAEINKIMEEKIGVNVNFHFIDWSDYGNKMRMLLTSGEKIDLMYTSNWANDFYSDVNKGAYQEIDFDMIKKYGPNIVNEVPEAAWDSARVDGKLYAMPCIQVIARWPGVLLQKKYAEKYNFDVDKVDSLNDFTPLFENITNNEDGILPIEIRKNGAILSYYLSKMGLEYFSETNPLGIKINDKDLNIINLYETDEMKDFLYLLRDWYKNGIIRSDAASVTDLTGEKQNGKLASIFAVNNPDTVVNQAKIMNLKPEDLVMVPLSEPYLSTSSVVGSMTAINAESEYPEKCIEVFNMMFDPNDTRCINLLSYGIEGKHYKQIEDDLIEVIPNSGYYVDSGWEYGCMFNCMRTNPNQPAWRPTGPDINKCAVVSPMMGFSFNSEPIKSELSQIAAVMDEYTPALLTGTLDVDETLAEFGDKLKKAGLEKVQKEIQSQIDSWKAAK